MGPLEGRVCVQSRVAWAGLDHFTRGGRNPFETRRPLPSSQTQMREHSMRNSTTREERVKNEVLILLLSSIAAKDARQLTRCGIQKLCIDSG
jgi:hypothetical protein